MSTWIMEARDGFEPSLYTE